MFNGVVDQVLQAFWVKYFITDNCWKDIEIDKTSGHTQIQPFGAPYYFNTLFLWILAVFGLVVGVIVRRGRRGHSYIFTPY